MPITPELRNKIRILEILWDNGARSEKDLLSLKLDDIITMSGVRIEDLKGIVEMRKIITKSGLFKYLFPDESEEKKKVSKPKSVPEPKTEKQNEADTSDGSEDDPEPEDPINWNS